MAVELTKEQARRIAVRAQLLDAARPTDLVDAVRHLTLVQIDPTAAIAPSADLVLWSRLGSSYRPSQLSDALAARQLFEADALIRPMEDVGLVLAYHDIFGYEGVRNWLTANDACRRDIVKRLKKHGPLASRELPDTCVVPWKSTGWTNDRNVTQMLELLLLRDERRLASLGIARQDAEAADRAGSCRPASRRSPTACVERGAPRISTASSGAARRCSRR